MAKYKLKEPKKFIRFIIFVILVIAGLVLLIKACGKSPAGGESSFFEPIENSSESYIGGDITHGTIRAQDLVSQLTAGLKALWSENINNRLYSGGRGLNDPTLYTIAIDAGHGGTDSGHEGSIRSEKEITLMIAIALRSYLEKNAPEISVVMTRIDNDNTSELEERREILDLQQLDYIISLHCNAFSSANAFGVEAVFDPTVEGNQQLAEDMITDVASVIGSGERYAKANAKTILLQHQKCPGMILYLGFLTNPTDEAQLNDTNVQKKIAEAIGKNIIETVKANSEKQKGESSSNSANN